LGGYELDSKRRRKATRLPNPAVPFSYVACSLVHDVPNLPIYVPSPGADTASNKMYSDIFSGEDLLELIAGFLNGGDVESACTSLLDKATMLVSILAENRRGNDSLDAKSWCEAEEFMRQGGTLQDYILKCKPMSWSKTAYIDSLTDTAANLMQVASSHAIGLTASNLPFCLVPGDARPNFANNVERMYPNLSEEFKVWLRSDNELVICWIMGFKPRGG